MKTISAVVTVISIAFSFNTMDLNPSTSLSNKKSNVYYPNAGCEDKTAQFLDAFEDVNGCLSSSDYNIYYNALVSFCEWY